MWVQVNDLTSHLGCSLWDVTFWPMASYTYVYLVLAHVVSWIAQYEYIEAMNTIYETDSSNTKITITYNFNETGYQP